MQCPQNPEGESGRFVELGIAKSVEERGGEPEFAGDEEEPQAGRFAHVFPRQPKDRPGETDREKDPETEIARVGELSESGADCEPEDGEASGNGEFEGIAPEPLGIGAGVLPIETGVVLVVEKPDGDEVHAGPKGQKEDRRPEAEDDPGGGFRQSNDREGSAVRLRDEGRD